MSDLNELFRNLKANRDDSDLTSIFLQPREQMQQRPSYQPPTVPSPLSGFSPPAHTPNPMHSSNIIKPVNPASTVGTPAPDQERTNNLLNLLRFNSQPSQANAPPAGPMANLQNVAGGRSSSTHMGSGNGQAQAAGAPRPLSAQDLFASIQSKSPAPGILSSPVAAAGAEKPSQIASPVGGSRQDLLLGLLKKPDEQKPVESVVQSIEPKESPSLQERVPERRENSIDRLAQSFAESANIKPTSPARQFGSTASRETTPFEAPQPTKASMFTYVNPFDELHASSPLSRTPKPEAQAQAQAQAPPPHASQPKIEILKHHRDASASGQNGESTAPAAKSRKIEETASPAPATKAEPETKKESVAEALEEVGEKVDKQVERALAAAEKKDIKTSKTKTKTKKGSAAQPTVKKDSADDVESSWESAEDSANDNKPEFKVKVFNFPMKPFVTIAIKPTGEDAQPVRHDNFMRIAELRKDFDQMDRNLVTASQSYIVYAQTGTRKGKHGFRVIRQDSGKHKEVFAACGERVFSVQICGSAVPANDVETVLATGVNGSVFWTSLAKSGPELFEGEDLEAQGFIMPAVPTPEENTSNSPVKTRAKCSSRHPEFFAISRSKMIYIISPDAVKGDAYIHKTTRRVDSTKYLEEHGLKINAGKAGKDFAFSEDDTVIASLDKSGVAKFWDIRVLTEKASDKFEDKHEPIELSKPLWSLTAAASGSKSDEKPSVSSIMLLDKDRAHSKGIALRYMLVGFKQNHILQLWDLGLGKAVQELRLPHEKDSDGICSITYHAKTGIIALGHPTRNSVYFLHLSAPKYNLPHMDQARYISMLAKADPNLPKPDSTAIISGLREFSFAKVGELRSLDMLKTPVDTAAEKGSLDEILFELYITHSRGILAMSIKRADLGWDESSKMVEPVDAEKFGVVEVQDLKVPPPRNTSAPESEASSQATAPSTRKKEQKNQEPARSGSATPARTVESAATTRNATASPAPATNGAQRAAQPSKQVPDAPPPYQQAAVNPPLVTPDSYAMAAAPPKSPVKAQHVHDAGEPAKKDVATSPTAVEPTTAIATSSESKAPTTGGELPSLLSKHFDTLYSKLEADKRVADAAGAAKQDAVLRLVSSTLTENVEDSLHSIIGAGIEGKVIPAITDTTTKIIDKKLGEVLPQHVSISVQREVKAALPNAIQQAMRDQQVHRTISEITATQVAQKVRQQVSGLLQQALPNMATQAAQKMVADMETRTQQRLHAAEAQRSQDNVKIDALTTMVRNLTETLQNVAEQQAAFQQQILALQAERAKEATPAAASAAATQLEPVVEKKSPEELEIEDIVHLLQDRKFDDATMKVSRHPPTPLTSVIAGFTFTCVVVQWLQSSNQASLFDNLFVRVNPMYLQHVSSLVCLSVSAAVTSSLETKLPERLDWLEAVLNQIDLRDQEIADVAPKIMDVLATRLQGAYMQASEDGGNPVVLKKIRELHRRVAEVRRVSG
jgi:hypothetical protein